MNAGTGATLPDLTPVPPWRSSGRLPFGATVYVPLPRRNRRADTMAACD